MSDEPIQHDDAQPTCQCIHGRILRGETTIDYSLFKPDLACMRCASTGYVTPDVPVYTNPLCICMDGDDGPDEFCRHCFGTGTPGGEE